MEKIYCNSCKYMALGYMSAYCMKEFKIEDTPLEPIKLYSYCSFKNGDNNCADYVKKIHWIKKLIGKK